MSPQTSGSTSKRTRNIVFFVLIVVAIFVFMDPFHIINRGAQAPEKPAISPETLATAARAFNQEGRDPLGLLTGLFEKKQVVLLGELGLVSEEAEFVASALPALDKAGVHMLGMEMLLAADQGDIDKLVTASNFDSALARRLIAAGPPMWGFQEYMDILKAAWNINAGHGAGTLPFRIIGIATAPDFSQIKNKDELGKPESFRKIFVVAPDLGLANATLRAFDPAGNGGDKNAKMLLLVQASSSLSRLTDPSYKKMMRDWGFGDQKRLGVILSEKMPGQVATVLCNDPWPNQKDKNGVAYAANGIFDAILSQKGFTASLPKAFDLSTSWFRNAAIDKSDFGQTVADAKAPLLGDIADGIIVFGQINTLHAARPIEGFIDEGTLPTARKAFPAFAQPEKMNSDDLNKQLAQTSGQYQQIFNSFR